MPRVNAIVGLEAVVIDCADPEGNEFCLVRKDDA
jgi:hypothetical protein